MAKLFSLVAATLLIAPLPACGDNADLHFTKAIEFNFAGQPDAAIIEYRRGLHINPMSATAHDQLGVLLLEQKGDVDGAISEFVTALNIEPGCSACQLHLSAAAERRNSKAYDEVNRGNMYYSAGDLIRACACYRIAIQNDPQDAVAHNSLAWTLYKLGKLNEGMSQVDEALRLKPDDPEFINTKACLLFDKGDLDGALSTWRKAIALSHKPAAADLYGIALGLLAKGDKTGAAENFKKAVTVDPRFRDLAYVRDRIGMSVQAVTWHDRLIGLSTKSK